MALASTVHVKYIYSINKKHKFRTLNRNLSGFINDINAVANCWMNKLSSYADESTSITMADYLGRFTLDLVTKVNKSRIT